MSQVLWEPTASIEVLKMRADLLQKIRQYFAIECVMEVETPILSKCATVDFEIDSFKTKFSHIGKKDGIDCFLHTSPEFAMKRLLVAGSGDIYTIAKVFRTGELGNNHNPEFTILEWYRVGMNLQQLMNDVTKLLTSVSDFYEEGRYSYEQLFIEALGINPHAVSMKELSLLVKERVGHNLDDLERSVCLDLLFTHVILPAFPMGKEGRVSGVFVYDYPVEMVALAQTKKNKEGVKIASRFELYINQLELANGYFELLDYQECERRFKKCQSKRKAFGKYSYPYDYRLIKALEKGMPECSGVAMGLDRLLMCGSGSSNIKNVISHISI